MRAALWASDASLQPAEATQIYAKLSYDIISSNSYTKC